MANEFLTSENEELCVEIIEVEMANEVLTSENEELRVEVGTLRLEWQKARRVLRELESDIVALRAFRADKDAEADGLRHQSLNLQAALAAATSADSAAPDAAALMSLQKKWLAAGGALGEVVSLAPSLRAKVDRLEQQVVAAIGSAVARNTMLEQRVTGLKAENQALQEEVCTLLLGADDEDDRGAGNGGAA
ncbi:hypothetical protein FOA52_000983 [Chlamydomonas sp. UWO 241]|nr:hypothetical protein FOA52_000983 [Chlamydomonas sp. UWO 241]